MLTKLQSQGMDSNTIVVITSNHGQEFNDTRSNSWGRRQQLLTLSGAGTAGTGLARAWQ